MNNNYRDKRWIEFRETILEMDGYSCIKCDRQPPHVVLQVHHKRYDPGKLPWEYPPEACEILCKGCHAREHGEIRPSDGWSLYSEDDLGGLYGTCECCGTPIRYVFYVQHEKWEPLAVGTECCDNLTGATKATESRKRQGRKKRFVESTRWKPTPSGQQISLNKKKILIEIRGDGGRYRIHINMTPGRKTFRSAAEAKGFAFELVETGEALKFARHHPLCEEQV